MTRTEWNDQRTALAERIDSLPDPEHPAVRGLIRKHDELLAFGLEHAYMTPEEAARA